jgi:hypothetical protein
MRMVRKSRTSPSRPPYPFTQPNATLPKRRPSSCLHRRRPAVCSCACSQYPISSQGWIMLCPARRSCDPTLMNLFRRYIDIDRIIGTILSISHRPWRLSRVSSSPRNPQSSARYPIVPITPNPTFVSVPHLGPGIVYQVYCKQEKLPKLADLHPAVQTHPSQVPL